MKKIIDKRCMGKTTRLLEYAQEHGCIVVEPTFPAAEYAKAKAIEMGYANLPIITATDFLRNRQFMRDDKDFVIDELDWFLITIGVSGYSNTVEEQNFSIIAYDEASEEAQEDGKKGGEN